MKPTTLITCGPDAKVISRRRGTPEYLPARIHPVRTDYAAYKDAVLRDIMHDTTSAPEYFCCIRAWKKLKQHEMAAILGCDQVTISDYEQGRLLPTTGTMERISTLFPLNGHSFDDYEALVMNNRVTLARMFFENGKPESAAHLLNEMPRKYWWEMIARSNGEPPLRDSETLAWEKDLLPINHAGDYLRAIREGLGLKSTSVAKAIGKSQTAIKFVEHNDHPGYGPTRQAMIDYYAQEEARQRETVPGFPQKPLFRQETLERFGGYSGRASSRLAKSETATKERG